MCGLIFCYEGEEKIQKMLSFTSIICRRGKKTKMRYIISYRCIMKVTIILHWCIYSNFKLSEYKLRADTLISNVIIPIFLISTILHLIFLVKHRNVLIIPVCFVEQIKQFFFETQVMIF